MVGVWIGNPRPRAYPVIALRSARGREDHVDPTVPLRQRRCGEVSLIPLRRADRTAAAVLAVGILSASSLESGQAPTAGSATELVRVRSSNPVVADAIVGAIEQSTTFRQLNDAIATTNGIVYVEEGRCRYNVRACLPLSVQIAGSFRYLRILVTLRRAIGCELLGAIGHELQHAVEVLQNPKIVDFNTLFHFYLQTAPTAGEVFETEAARRAGLRVRAEVIASKTCKQADVNEKRLF